ncbi:MAG: Phage lysin, 1,4-beta-N-acetylmuramidase or lysozyme, partial [uncultured Solirubrobacteraceae bacterium]
GECASTHPRRVRCGAHVRRACTRVAGTRVDGRAAGRVEGQRPLRRRHRRHPRPGDGAGGPRLPASPRARGRRARRATDPQGTRPPRRSDARPAAAQARLARLGRRRPAVPARQAGLPLRLDRRRPRREDRPRAPALPGVGRPAVRRHRRARDDPAAEAPVAAVAGAARAAGQRAGRRPVHVPRLAPARGPRLPGAERDGGARSARRDGRDRRLRPVRLGQLHRHRSRRRRPHAVRAPVEHGGPPRLERRPGPAHRPGRLDRRVDRPAPALRGLRARRERRPAPRDPL